MDKVTLLLVNQIFEIERKLHLNGVDLVDRNLERIKHDLKEHGIRFIDPTGEPFLETRTDCQASIVGDLSGNMVITKVMKPIVLLDGSAGTQLIQQATVIVEKD